MKIPDPAVFDFETDGIEPRPAYPPEPVGVSILLPGEDKPKYHAFGHVGCYHCDGDPENNTTAEGAARALRKAYAAKDGVLCQNAKFDVDVADVHLGLEVPPWDRIHDTMFQIFLDDPNQPTFSLKPAAERILGMKPDERDAVKDWLLTHQPMLFHPDEKRRVKISASPSSDTYYMKFLRYAPGGLVGRYAGGDVVRTRRLHRKIWPTLGRRGMLPAYDRERQLMPILLEMERQGVPVRLKLLERDVYAYADIMKRLDAWLKKEIRASGDLNLDSGEQLIAAMIKSRKVDPQRVPVSAKTGKHLSNKEALHGAVKDASLLAVLRYRGMLKTYHGTFMRTWHSQGCAALLKKGEVSPAMRKAGLSLVYTSWNQVKGDGRGGSNAGARTGRISATLFMNIPKEATPLFRHEGRDRREREKLPPRPKSLSWLPPLPVVRRYIAPFPDEQLIDRDYSQQEPRILAHFDGGSIMQMYIDDPWMDFHDKVREELAKVGLFYERRPVKNTGLGLIYGMGVSALAERNGMEVPEAKKLKDAVLRLLPGVKLMYQDARVRMAENRPIKTWGGRLYFCEKPKVIDGRMRTFDYKLPNALVQGSAADCTKEAIIRFHAAKDKRTRLLLNVHDQLTASAPRSIAKAQMKVMRETMESVEFDVQILTEGSASSVSWADLVDTDKKGKELAWPR